MGYPGQRVENRFIWFKKWILERQTFKTLSQDSGFQPSFFVIAFQASDRAGNLFRGYIKVSPYLYHHCCVIVVVVYQCIENIENRYFWWLYNSLTGTKTYNRMHSWKTDLIVTPAVPIQLNDPIATFGSCFADVIGNYLATNKFNTLTNPFSSVYNPISIHRILQLICRKEMPVEMDFVKSQGVFFHYQFHSSFYDSSPEALKEKIFAQIKLAHDYLKRCRIVIITYGTTFVYRRTDTQMIVANCHKIPSSLFTKELLSVNEILNSANETITLLRNLNPEIRIITTISPVRHTKDTLSLNSVSKSILRLCTHELQSSSVDYFPAYEIMMDDLRDYRFYQQDRIHPTKEAEDYIWQKFVQTYFDAETTTFLNEWKEVKHALAHRAQFPSTPAHQSFLKATLSRLQRLQHKVDVGNEIAFVTNQIITP
ncbi:MAG: GSCFA domain-containing protein [Cyclobacteriaceae bacterium]|nr:GSCFA domain-containing protein [Cyclobacteriaceae bacterium]